VGVEITTEGRVFGVLERVFSKIQWLWPLLVVAPVLVLGEGLGEGGGGVGQIASLGVVGGLVGLVGALVVNKLVEKGGVEYLSLRAALGASNSESDTSKVSTFTSR